VLLLHGCRIPRSPGTMVSAMSHEFFTTYTDGSQVRMTCDTCGEGYTFMSSYFATQWANRHAIPGMVARPIGEVA